MDSLNYSAVLFYSQDVKDFVSDKDYVTLMDSLNYSAAFCLLSGFKGFYKWQGLCYSHGQLELISCILLLSGFKVTRIMSLMDSLNYWTAFFYSQDLKYLKWQGLCYSHGSAWIIQLHVKNFISDKDYANLVDSLNYSAALFYCKGFVISWIMCCRRMWTVKIFSYV